VGKVGEENRDYQETEEEGLGRKIQMEWFGYKTGMLSSKSVRQATYERVLISP